MLIADLAFQIEPLIFKRLQKITVQRDGFDLLQFEHLRQLVDKGVEGIGRRNDEHMVGAQLFIVIHEVTEPMQKDHGLAAARAAL